MTEFMLILRVSGRIYKYFIGAREKIYTTQLRLPALQWQRALQ